MRFKAGSRDNLAKALSLAVGVLFAWQLHAQLRPKPDWNLLPLPKVVRVSVKSAAPKEGTSAELSEMGKVTGTSPAARPQPGPKNSSRALTKSLGRNKISSDTPVAKPVAPAPGPNLPGGDETPANISVPPVLTLEQPPLGAVMNAPVELPQIGALPSASVPGPVASAVTVPVPPLLDDKGAPVLPQVAGAPRPPMPDVPTSGESLYLDKPGGDVLVLVLFLNDQGVVIDSSIGVPSAYPLEDLTLAWASLGQRWRDLKPPLMPGEVRRLELRVPYEKTRKKPENNVLP